MRYVLGLDGGGTKTVAVVADETGNVLGWGQSGPMNISFVSLELATRSVTEAITTALAEAGPAVAAIDLACVGSAGPVDMIAPGADLPIRTWHIAYEHGLCLGSTVLEGDAAVILAGTGCFEYARGPKGEFRTDGRGILLGDEGSGYWIAREALVAIGREADKRGPATRLSGLFFDQCGVTDALGLAKRIYRDPGMTRHEIAALARHVTAAAAEGDKVALAICQDAAQRLAHGALVCARETGLLEQERFPVALCGGVMSGGHVITEAIMQAIHQVAPHAYALFPRYHPAVGGVLAGLKELGVSWSPELLRNLDESLRVKGRLSYG